ncbi:hypothetical protein DVA67_019690 [Solirubrobacter sp. CPCC 204708]|uniref:Intracellular proteinase inhibitor BsuPI domain-containing protein n=1 Tax=Solirubrobacter deserti TaxID=2282478 RepID=A0ABT4RG61_9ACTN|nr:hypothetical protein [Solirubrobacter deserti]MBE2318214.1 hypothetical protein [Solirubrobacter deserti]MDA0137495.1 hypothetical protein [Solirubrobacter deserti]
MRRVVLLAVLALAGCGEARQDADEPSGEFKVEVVEASFPETQHVAERAELKVTVRNGESEERLRNVAVTVETKPRGEDAALAFGRNVRGAGLSSAGRPIWVLDEGPAGSDTSSVNTWSAGELFPGQEKELVWKVVPAKAGTYEISYRVSPGLAGKARPAAGRTSGTFTVVIEDEPVPARVNDDGEVERGGEPPGGEL